MSLEQLLADRQLAMMYLSCYLQHASRVFETYWTTVRSVEAKDNNHRLLDLTVCGQHETWGDSLQWLAAGENRGHAERR